MVQERKEGQQDHCRCLSQDIEEILRTHQNNSRRTGEHRKKERQKGGGPADGFC